MSYLKNIIRTAGLSLVNIQEEEKKLVINSIFEENKINIMEMFIARNFLIINQDLMTNKQQRDFAAIMAYCVNRSNQQKGRITQENDVKELLDLKSIDGIKELEELSKNFSTLPIFFNDQKIKIEDKDYQRKEETFVKRKIVKVPNFYKEGIDLNELIPSLNSKEIFSIFSFHRKHKKNVSEILSIMNMKKKSKVKSLKDNLSEAISRINSDVLFSINVEDMMVQVKNSETFGAYSYFKTLTERRLNGLYPDHDKIISICVKEKGIFFTKEDLDYELKNNVLLENELNKINKLVNIVPNITINDNYLEKFPFLKKNENLYENFLNLLIQSKKNMVVKKNEKPIRLFTEDIDSDYTFYFIVAKREYQKLYLNIILNEKFKDQEVTNRFGEELLNKIFGIDNILDDYGESLEVKNREHLDEIIDFAIKTMKNSKKQIIPENLRIHDLHRLLNPYSFIQNIKINEFKDYIKKLEDKANETGDEADIIKLLLIHMISVGAVGKSIYLDEKIEVSPKEEYLKAYDDERNHLKLLYLSEIANVGNLLKISKDSVSPLVNFLVPLFLEYNERNEITIGVSHNGTANLISQKFLQNLSDPKYDLNNDQEFQYLFEKSKKILKSILENSPDALLFINSIAPFSELEGKNYIEMLIDDVKKEDKYANIIKNINWEEGLSNYNIWNEISHKNNNTLSLKKILNNNIFTNDKEISKSNIKSFEKVLNVLNGNQIVKNEDIINFLLDTNLSKIDCLKVRRALVNEYLRKDYVENFIKQESLFVGDIKQKIRELNLTEVLDEKNLEKKNKAKKKI